MLNKEELKNLVKKTLEPMNLYSKSAEELIMGTIAHESLFGKYRKQIRGPALGIIQMEPNTFNWLKGVYDDRFPFIKNFTSSDLVNNDELAIIFCRLRYLVVPESLPSAGDLVGQARYWKKYYNTVYGKGRVKDYIKHYKEFVED